MQPRYLFAAAIAFGGLMADAIARPNYPSRIPTSFSCSTCHFAAGGGGERNAFGIDFPANGHTWAGVCALDSDGDGFTNGEEFGDPMCAWMPDDPRPDFPATRPGDDSDFPPDAPEPEAPQPDAEPAPQPDAEPAPQPDAEPAPQPDAEPAPQPDAEPAPQPDAEPAPTAEAPEPDAEPAPTAEAPEPDAEPAPTAEAPEPAPTADMGVGGGGDSDDGGCNVSMGDASSAPLFGLAALILGLRRRRRG